MPLKNPLSLSFQTPDAPRDAELEALLPHVVAVAEAAGDAIMRQRNNYTRVTKPDGSPVTSADMAAHHLILDALRALTPWPVISEEDHVPPEGFDTSKPYWLVDPLDGTAYFVEGKDHFAVNIGLVVGGVPVLGVVHLPVKGSSVAAAAKALFTKNKEEALTPLSPEQGPHAPLRLLTSPTFGRNNPALDAWRATLPPHTLVMVGGAEKFNELAKGEGDYYPRFGKCYEWDTAAGDAMLRAAGGGIRDDKGAVLAYGKPGWRNPSFIAYAPGRAPR